MATVWVPFDYLSGKQIPVIDKRSDIVKNLKDDEVLGILVSDPTDYETLRKFAGFDSYIIPCFLPDSQPDLTPPREPTKLEKKLKQKIAKQAARLAFQAIRTLIMLTNPLVAVIVIVVAISAYIYFSSNGSPNTAENINKQDAIETFDIMAVPVYLGLMLVPERFELKPAKNGCSNTGEYKAPDKKRIASIIAEVKSFERFKIQIFKEPSRNSSPHDILILANITPFEIDANGRIKSADAIQITHKTWQVNLMDSAPTGFFYQIMQGAVIDFSVRLRDDQTPTPTP